MTDVATRPDEALIQALATARPGEVEYESSARDLWVRYGGLLHKLASKYVGAIDADDVVQDAFYRIVKNASRFTSDRTAKPWIMTICKRECLRALHKRTVERSRASTFNQSPEGHAIATRGQIGVLEHLVATAIADANANALWRLVQALRHAIRTLPEEDRMVLLAYGKHGRIGPTDRFDIPAQVREKLEASFGIETGGVRQRWRRAQAKLKAQLIAIINMHNEHGGGK